MMYLLAAPAGVDLSFFQKAGLCVKLKIDFVAG